MLFTNSLLSLLTLQSTYIPILLFLKMLLTFVLSYFIINLIYFLLCKLRHHLPVIILQNLSTYVLINMSPDVLNQILQKLPGNLLNILELNFQISIAQPYPKAANELLYLLHLNFQKQNLFPLLDYELDRIGPLQISLLSNFFLLLGHQQIPVQILTYSSCLSQNLFISPIFSCFLVYKLAWVQYLNNCLQIEIILKLITMRRKLQTQLKVKLIQTNQYLVLITMIGKDSISFGSIRQSSVWHNQDPPALGQNNSITFHEFPPQSRTFLDESIIKKIPAAKTSQQINKFMQKNLDVVCLFQAAEIKRLVTNLQSYQIKQNKCKNIDLSSYKMNHQIVKAMKFKQDSLLKLLTVYNYRMSSSLQNVKNQKILFQSKTQSVQLQKTEIEKLFQQLKQKQQIKNQMLIFKSEYQTISRKYEKSIESLNKLFDDNEHLTLHGSQLNEQNAVLRQQIAILKEHVIQLQQRKQLFEQQRIRQIQRMRESYEMKIQESSIYHQEQISAVSQFSKINKQLQQKNGQLKKNIGALSQQLKITQNKFITAMEQSKKLQNELGKVREEFNKQLQKSNAQREDFNQKFGMFGDQIQRLNEVLKNKQELIKKIITEIQTVRSVNNKQKITQKEQLQTLQKSKQQEISSLKQRLQRVIISIQNKQRQFLESINLKNQEISHLKLFYQKQLQKLKLNQIQEKKLIVQEYNHIIQKDSEIKQKATNKQIELLQNETLQLRTTINEYKVKIQQIMSKNQQNSYTKQNIIRNYQEKIREYFQQNQSLKKDHDLLHQDMETFISQNQKLKSENSFLSESNMSISQQFKHLSQKYQEIKNHKNLVQIKVKNLEREKLNIEKQLQKQIVKFMQSNHKTSELITEHKAKIQMVDYHKYYSTNHVILLEQIQKLATQILGKEERNLILQKKIQQLQKIILRLQNSIKEYQNIIVQDLKTKDEKLETIDQGINQLSSQKQVIQKNSQLVERLNFLQMTLKQHQILTQKVIVLTTENVKLKHKLQQCIQQISSSKNNVIELQAELVLLQKSKISNHNLNLSKIQEQQQNKTNKRIQQIFFQFKGINQSLLLKLSQIQKRQFQEIQEMNSKKILQAQSQIYNMTNSMSLNPSKLLSVTKLPEQNNRSQYIQTIETLRNQKTQIEHRYNIAMLQKQSMLSEIRNLQRQANKYESESKQFESLCEINKKLSEQNRELIHENDVLIEQLKSKESMIMNITNRHREIQDEMKIVMRKYTEMMESSDDYHGLASQMQQLQKQLKNKQIIVQNYNQKVAALQSNVSILQSQIKAYQAHSTKLQNQILLNQHQHQSIQTHFNEIEKFNQTLLKQLTLYKRKQSTLQSQKLSLKSINYNFALEIQKSKFTNTKIHVLNQQISRLQKQNIDLIQELDICKFQICQDLSLQRKNQQLLALLVMTFIQVQSLRSRVKEKDAQISTIRKSNLNPYKNI